MTNREICTESTPQSPPRIDREAGSVLDADALFVDGDVVQVIFRGERYQLRRTRAGKLILTK